MLFVATFLWALPRSPHSHVSMSFPLLFLIRTLGIRTHLGNSG